MPNFYDEHTFLFIEHWFEISRNVERITGHSLECPKKVGGLWKVTEVYLNFYVFFCLGIADSNKHVDPCPNNNPESKVKRHTK